MPHRVRAAQQMLQAIRRCNREAIARSGQLDIEGVANILGRYNPGASGPPVAFRLVIAEYLAIAVEANVVDLDHWKPYALRVARDAPAAPPRRRPAEG